MTGPIDIAALKNNTTQGLDASSDTIIDPNVARSAKNIDGKEARDFGNGLKEFDPSAAGFTPVEPDRGKGDDELALEAFDKQMAAREEEVRVYNELLEINGGEVSEEELREALGESHITEVLKDGSGGKYEDEPEIKATVKDTVESASNLFKSAEESNKNTDSEIDELEKELAEDYEEPQTSRADIQNISNRATKESSATTVQQDEIIPEVSKPTAVTEFSPRKESEIDDDGVSQEDKDLAALDGTASDEDDEGFEEKLKKELNKKLQPVSRKLNVSSMTVIQKPVNVNHLIEKTQGKGKRVFTWPLIKSGRPITIQTFNATELNVLSNNARNANMTLEVFRTIWKHITSAKGDSFESWCKTTSYFDVDHIWMAIYGACFSKANYLPFSCPKCHDVTVTTDTPIMDMVKFKNDEAKAKFEAIMKMRDDDPAMGNIYAEQIVQVSDDIAVGFTEPTIYTSIVENAMYDREFRDKYSDIINIVSYISNIYMVTDEGLRPVTTKTFTNNESKTAKAKVIQYAKVIRALSSDEYAVIMSHIIEMGRTVDEVSYQMPEITCDHCKATIPAEDQDASGLVFTRHQLVMFGA